MSTEGQMPVLRALSALLRYPTEEVVAAAGEIRTAVDAEPALDAARRAALHGLIAQFEAVGRNAADLLDLQERYVAHFDRSRALSLHLFEHVHGESRDRGQAMVDLLALYEKRGLMLAASELPDFLPVFLEYCGSLPRAEAADMLGQVAHILAVLAQRLRARESDYAAVFDALCALAGTAADEQLQADADSARDEDSDNFAALDRAWQEDPVVFGPDLGGCGGDQLVAKLRYGRRAQPPVSGQPEPGHVAHNHRRAADRHAQEGA
jgi:nitrate reductase delta subunit